MRGPRRPRSRPSVAWRRCAPVSLAAVVLACAGEAVGRVAQEAPVSGPAGQPVAADEPLTNALSAESSPYLLQHAANPVAWQPWGTAAIERARAEDKPILVSIGYSTCYWCHVMERESFENEELAALINEYFVPVKVDREELPTVDDVYMTAVQLRTGSGGWPLNVFLDPVSLDVFFGGTYFPPEGGPGRPGFGTVVEVLGERWREGGAARAPLLEDARRLGSAVREVLATPQPPVPLDAGLVERAVDRILARHDANNGGFGDAPKFPSEPDLELLAEVADEREDAAAALDRTLEAMANGGIHDHLGGGFHRYSTDATWTVPHFEKMLYTQGQLAPLYAAAAARFESDWYRKVARGVVDYVATKLTGARGQYLSAQDAEVDGREGEPYVWTLAQIEGALEVAGPEWTAAAVARFGVTEQGNFVDPHHPEERGWNVLRLSSAPENSSNIFGPSVERAAANGLLFEARERREQPRTDDKTLAGWSGLMAAGAAETGALLGDAASIERAATALTFVDTVLRDGDGRLRRSWREGRLGPVAVSEDHAFLLRGLLALHAATDSDGWLERAAAVYDEARDLFFDEERGGWYDSAPGGEDLLPIRAKSIGDGALPGANSELLLASVELGRRTGEARFLDDATATLEFLSPTLSGNPAAMPRAVVAIARLLAFAPERLPTGPAPPAARDSQVAFFLEPDRATSGAEDQLGLTLTLEIAEGFHLNAPDPGAVGLAGLAVTLSGAPGVELAADLPEGEPFTGPLDDVVLLVLEGRVEIPLVLRGPIPDPAALRVDIAYQACDDRQCLPPRSVSLRLPESIR